MGVCSFARQDIAFLETYTKGELEWDVYCLCDGHGGAEAAQYIQSHLTDALRFRLPQERPRREGGFSSWALQIRQAVVEAFEELDSGFERALGEDCQSGVINAIIR